ncbi:MAG: hypothetical protein HXX14_12575 [Bacteroidetes bacterium]|nr:hypothetical protein [Bacteroidota bacterium]
MKYLALFSVCLFFVFASCMKEESTNITVVPNKPFIKSVTLAKMSTTGLIQGSISQTNQNDTTSFTNTVIVNDKTIDLTNIWASANLETGCTIEPLEGATEFGKYGNFSKSNKYKVTAPSGRSATWTVIAKFVN